MHSLRTLAVVALPLLVSAFAPGLKLELSLDKATQGISISSDGRRFLSQRYSTTLAPIANASNFSSDPRTTFVSIDDARIGPDGRYWLVDGGSTGINGSTKLVGVNLTTDEIDKIYYLDSAYDDVRFNANNTIAYLSDTAGALLVLDLATSSSVCVLVDDPSAHAYFPVSYNGSLVPGYGRDGSTLSVGLDQMEVSPDGKYLYYQPCNGGLYRIETSLVDASLHNTTLVSTLGSYSIPFAPTPSTGGSTIDANGNIYISDTNILAIWKITPEGRATILVQDDALVWTDLMWITPDKKLWLPASQMRLGKDGLMAEGPNYIFSYEIEAGPSLIDHA